MNIATQDGDSDREFRGNPLQLLNEVPSLQLVRLGRIVIIEVIQKIDTAIKLIEQTPAQTESTVQELDRSYDWASKNVFEPSETLILLVQRALGFILAQI